eukprot:TRINITY_DN6010_c0_g1_i1.p1 TRINITY_DN6010_c0_g1~~TRINITY_DN6010_c0_g1_i1.p1  ORF type:complete len:493 (+),score=12.11 TRINITY_DN6010_c0_g1_i1:90-1568(+)
MKVELKATVFQYQRLLEITRRTQQLPRTSYSVSSLYNITRQLDQIRVKKTAKNIQKKTIAYAQQTPFQNTGDIMRNALETQNLQKESEFCVINFYHLIDVSEPKAVVESHKNYISNNHLDLRGRIYISSQGVNAQFGGIKQNAIQYAEWVKQQLQFQGMMYQVFAASDYSFPKLRLQYKPNLISLMGGMKRLPLTNPTRRASHITPVQWQEMMQHASKDNTIILDLRNNYEWDAGHFSGAQRPEENHFNETVEDMSLLQGVDKDRRIMMYCTGGIRCDVFSTVLREKGYSNLYTLSGGIQNYLQQEKQHWEGSLFVFDSRLAVSPENISKGRAEAQKCQAAVNCQMCGQNPGELPHLNCANIDCNKLFVACKYCKKQFKGCCSAQCQQAPRLLRPFKEQGNYGNWVQYSSDEEGDMLPGIVDKIKGGRKMGRAARRRRRKKLQIQRHQEQREVKLARKTIAKHAMETVSQESQLKDFLSMDVGPSVKEHNSY